MQDIIYGRNSVQEAIEAGREINKLLVLEGARDKSIQRIVDAGKSKKYVIQFVDRKKLDQIAEGENHQGVIAYVAPFTYVEVDEILNRAEAKGEAPFIVICDEIMDPHNLGSLIRSANAAGAHGVIIPKRRSAAVNQTVVKTSSGAVEYVPVARVTNLVQTIRKLKEKGVWIVGTDMDAPVYHQADLTGALAIVIGNEGGGIGRLVAETCDFMVSIPMLGEVASLNASVAGGIVLYEAVRQRYVGSK